VRRTLLPITAALALMMGAVSPAAAQDAQVDPQIFDKAIAERAAHSQGLEAANAQITAPDHPQKSLNTAAISADQGLMAVFAAEKPGGLGDRLTVSAEIRKHADAMLDAADVAERDVATLADRARDDPSMQSETARDKVEAALTSYRESLAGEREISQHLTDIAARVEQPGEVDWEAVETQIAAIETLFQNRDALAQARKAAFDRR
jgi:flagellar basal body L-ring protein FlgH